MNVTRVNKLEVNNTIVDFANIGDVPMPINPRWDTEESKIYDSQYAYDRSQFRKIGLFDNKKEVNDWARNFMHTHIFPKFVEDWRFNNAYPCSLAFLKDNSIMNVTLLRDSVGFGQPIHSDPQFHIFAGAIHLQDSPNNGTIFARRNYQQHAGSYLNEGWEMTHRSPSDKFSGSVWATMADSHHGVDIVTSERLIYLIIGAWEHSIFGDKFVIVNT